MLVLFAIDVVVTLVFRADVEAQSGAYATGVLVLILSAAFAATLALWRERRRALAIYTGVVCLVFAYTLVDNCLERPDGLIIGSVFTFLLMTVSGLSRSLRSVELRIPQRLLQRTSRAGAWDRSCGARRCTWCRSERLGRGAAAGRGRRSPGTTTCAGRSCSCT